jgi:DNA-binding transcriptional MocR family regulator
VFPAVPRGQSRLRFSITAANNREQIDEALYVLGEVLQEEGIILNGDIGYNEEKKYSLSL